MKGFVSTVLLIFTIKKCKEKSNYPFKMYSMKRKLPLFFTLVLLHTLCIKAQTPEVNCGSHESQESYFQTHPEALQEHLNFNEYTRQFAQNRNENDSQETEFVIPVVFHVYGTIQNGDTVDYNTIVNSLNQVNEEFQGLNADYNTVDANFLGIRSPMDITFKLARLDPNGACTTGVAFHPEASGHGNFNSPVVAADAWDNYKYMNVYITGDLYGDGVTNNSGVAWFPDTGMSDANIARVVYNGQYLTGNTSNEFASVLTHEFGHWLNLFHTHEGGCSNGDQVADTPGENIGGDCNETVDCGNNINYENYMGYNGAAGCYKMFTIGQVDRMLAALNHPARITLWQDSNLDATGVNEDGGIPFIDTTEMFETIPNDGSFESTINLGLENATFALSGALTEGTHYNVTLPEGLSVSIDVQNDTQAVITLSGQATNHGADDSTIATIELLGASITGGLSSVSCSTLQWNLTFNDPYEIIYVDNNDLTVSASNVWEPFTDQNIPSLGGGTNYGGLFYNTSHPSGQAALQFETYTEGMVCNGNTLNISMLPDNTLISVNSNFVDGQNFPNLHDIRSVDYTEWDGQTNYAGFRFAVNGNDHYGWFRFQVAADGQSYTLLDYAYNTEPFGDIFTGQQALSTSDVQDVNLGIQLYPNPVKNNFTIYTGELQGENITVDIYNLLGQRVYQNAYSQVEETITITEKITVKGYYFVKVTSDNASTTIRIIKD